MDSILEQAATYAIRTPLSESHVKLTLSRKAQALEKQLDQSLNDSTAPLEQVVALLNG